VLYWRKVPAQLMLCIMQSERTDDDV